MAKMDDEVIDDDELEGEEEGPPQDSTFMGISAMSYAPWWVISVVFHGLAILLVSLITMTIGVVDNTDAVIVTTNLERAPVVVQQEQPKVDSKHVLESKHDTPPTDPTSDVASDIVVPPDILAKAELGDHFETINPDRPDTHSAFGNPDAHMFHSVSGDDDAAGGGGTGGLSLEDMIGVGGASSPGTGGGWGGGNGTGTGIDNGAGHGSFGARNGGGRRLMVMRHGGSRATEGGVDRALKWLAAHQEVDGHWDCVKYGGKQADVAVTGMALLAFLGAGHTERPKPRAWAAWARP
ncbi:MAG: hypothetical protein HY291_00705 [Planctomycetes bacterium]|nr:hypothetical protein [Planctomycetota bacterium]